MPGSYHPARQDNRAANPKRCSKTTPGEMTGASSFTYTIANYCVDFKYLIVKAVQTSQIRPETNSISSKIGDILIKNVQPVKKISGPETIDYGKVDEPLLRRLSELTVLHNVATACVECTSEDELVERATQAIGEKLYPDSFGILLVDKASGVLRFHGSYRGLPDQFKTIPIPVGKGITGQVAATGIPRCIADVTFEPGYVRLYFQTRSELCVPIKVGERVIGVINAESSLLNLYNDADQRLLSTLAGQLATALERLRLLEETQRRLHEATLLSNVIALTTSADDLSSALNQVCAEVAQFFQAPQAGFALLDRDNTSAEIIAEYRAPGRSSAIGIRIPVADNPSMAYILEHKQPLAVIDAQNDPALAPVRDIMRQREVASILLVPILLDGKVAGTLGIDDLKRHEFKQSDITLMQNVARQVGQALERVDLLAKTREQARQVQRIMDTVPDGVLLLDKDRRIVLANLAAWQYLSILVADFEPELPITRLAGYAMEDFLTENSELPWREFALPDRPNRIFEIAVRPMEKPVEKPLPLRGPHKRDASASASSGQVPDEEKNLDSSVAAPPQNDKSVKEGWVLVLRDVSQERETRARIQVQERLATVGQLAAGIAHDFNNIMAAIVVYSELLALEPNLSQASLDRLVIIQQQIQRATSLIRQILDFSRRSVMEQSSLDLLTYIKELDRLLGRVLPENIRLELTYKPGSYLVNADPTRLQQVFMNLALNARDAMPSGGTLHFELKRLRLKAGDPPPPPDLTEGEWIRIEVRDTGAGIHSEVMPHIFDPFFSTKPVGEGTGLGLAQVYGIIKQHGGSIVVDSQINQGTSFFIYLPALPVPEEEAPSPAAFPELKGAGETILVVEDDWVARDAIQALLEAHDFRTLVAFNGVEALQIYSRKGDGIAAVVSDVVMPEMGGVALYNALRLKQPAVKMLFITGHPLDAEDQTVLEEGQVNWLQKPFNVSDFIHRLKDLLEGSS
jgi:signal transduction histidine kinase/putative methionine-R-sulfoxide reductase with GAF domain